MAKKHKRRNSLVNDIQVLDQNGRVIGEENEAKASINDKIEDFFFNLVRILATVYPLIRAQISRWWNNLAVPHPISEEERKVKLLKESRDNILTVTIMAILLFFAKLPLLLTILGSLELLLFLVAAILTRDSVKNGNSTEKTEQKISELNSPIRGYIILVIILTALSWAIANGYLSSVTETFPLLANFADWQINKVNELFEFIKNLF